MKAQQNLFGLDNSLQVPSIPYMGNKRKLATRIINTIIDIKGNDFKHLYDLFGGGGSISIAALNLWGKEIHYNEFNTAIVNLMRHIQKGGEIPYKWVTREEFFKCLEGDTWWDGLVQSCWSFGNKQSSYLYGKDIEDIKYLAHKVCVDKDLKGLKELETLTGFGIPLDFNCDPQQIRLQMKRIAEKYKERFDVQHLERVIHIERLQRLQNLQHLQHLQITNLSYEQVEINKKSILYCDIPYRGTGEYKEGGFDYDKFYGWALNNDNPVFISEYNMPDDFEIVASFHHKSTLSATNNNKVVIENLYWNGK